MKKSNKFPENFGFEGRLENGKFKNRLMWFQESEVRVALIFFIVAFLIVVSVTSLYNPSFQETNYSYHNLYGQPDFWSNILVEAHGLLLDILVIGIFLLWFNKRLEKKREIKKYQQEIHLFQPWKQEEATHRIVGNIKHLNDLGVTKIDMSFCYLKHANILNSNLKDSLLWSANLENACIENTILEGVSFIGANLRGASIVQCNLEGANFSTADLSNSVFMGLNLNLKNINLEGAKLEGARFPKEMLPYLKAAKIDDETLNKVKFLSDPQDLLTALYDSLQKNQRWNT